MNYAKVGQSVEQVGAQNALAGPQLITRLGEQVRGLIELRTRLRSVNKALRGIQPSPSESKADTPKPVEMSLADVTSDVELLLEQCHSEASEIQALLS